MNLKDKTVVIDNKTYRYSKIVMLSTTNYNNPIFFLGNDNKLYKEFRRIPSSMQHLYFLSTDKICEGDWCYYQHPKWKHKNGMITRVENLNYSEEPAYKLKHTEGWGVIEGYKKIIASTDPSLNLPKPSDSFLQVYIDAYNKDEKIEECLVEYEKQFDYKDKVSNSKYGYGFHYSIAKYVRVILLKIWQDISDTRIQT